MQHQKLIRKKAYFCPWPSLCTQKPSKPSSSALHDCNIEELKLDKKTCRRILQITMPHYCRTPHTCTTTYCSVLPNRLYRKTTANWTMESRPTFQQKRTDTWTKTAPAASPKRMHVPLSVQSTYWERASAPTTRTFLIPPPTIVADNKLLIHQGAQ